MRSNERTPRNPGNINASTGAGQDQSDHTCRPGALGCSVWTAPCGVSPPPGNPRRGATP